MQRSNPYLSGDAYPLPRLAASPLLSSRRSNANRSGRPITTLANSGCDGLIRKLAAEGMMALGTRRISDLP